MQQPALLHCPHGALHSLHSRITARSQQQPSSNCLLRYADPSRLHPGSPWLLHLDAPHILQQGDTHEFAYSFPFSYTSLQYELGFLDFLGAPFYRRQLVAR